MSRQHTVHSLSPDRKNEQRTTIPVIPAGTLFGGWGPRLG